MKESALQCNDEKIEQKVFNVQKIADMLQVKSTGKRVDDTEIMRTSSSNSSSTMNGESTSDSVPAVRQSG